MDDRYKVRERIDQQLEEARIAYWDYRSARALGMKTPEEEADEASEEELEELEDEEDEESA
jgi:hypothetical protein